jgi:hypothetical protein
MCGLFGIINSKPDTFRSDIFTVLGIANDSRGGDSCGVFIDGKVEYGIGQRALFENFFWDSKLINNTEVCQVALGHDRKASVGAVTIEKAHPIIIKNKEGNTDFVLIHNGTIHNYEDLAKKYIPNIDYKNYSDSQVLALILYYKGFDVLSEYQGGTAFIAVDYRKGEPITYFFKGASKETSTSEKESVERPLFLAFDKNKIVLSSIASYLCALMKDVYEVKSNRVYEYTNGKIYIYKTIDRSKCTQSKYTYVYTDYNGYSSYNYIKWKNIDNCYYEDTTDEPLHGKYRISNYGRIMKKKNGEIPTSTMVKIFTIYFFKGIPFRDKYSYNIVNKAYKKSKLTKEEFLSKNMPFIRFYSASPQFFDGQMCMMATSETGYIPYNGTIYVLGRCESRVFHNGVFEKVSYGQDYMKAFEIMKL